MRTGLFKPVPKNEAIALVGSAILPILAVLLAPELGIELPVNKWSIALYYLGAFCIVGILKRVFRPSKPTQGDSEPTPPHSRPSTPRIDGSSQAKTSRK